MTFGILYASMLLNMTDYINPVHFHNGAWYFWDETWTIAHGPFDTEELANQACIEYAKWLDMESPTNGQT